MPRVQEYLPEQDAQGPVGQTSPMLEQVGMFGRGVEEFGRDVEDAGTILHQRETQAETSDAYASVAEQRADMYARIQHETNDGTLNIGKVQKDYQDWVEKQYDTYNTTSGKDAFVRASSRAGGSLLQTATRGYAVIQGNRAKDNLTTLMNTNSSMVMTDPSQFPDLHDSQVEAIQAQVDAGAISQPEAEKMKQLMNLQLSKGAVRGWMQTDYNNIKNEVVSSGGKVDPNTDHLNVARKMLDAGGFDQFMDSDTKKALQGEIRQNQSAAESAGRQQIMAKENALTAQGAAQLSKFYEQLRTGGYDPAQGFKAAQAGLISPSEQLQLNHLAEAQQEKESFSNPTAYTNLMQRILSPDNTPGHISDKSQLAYLVSKKAEDFGPGSPNIGMGDFHKLGDAISMAQGPTRFKEAQLMEKASEVIGTNSPDSAYRMMQFHQEVDMAKQAAQKNKEPLDALFDSKSPSYLGNKLQDYALTKQQNLRKQADQIRGQNPAPAPIVTQPGVIPTPAKQGGMMADLNSALTDAKQTLSEAFPENKTPSGQDFASRYNTSSAPVAGPSKGKEPDIANMSESALRKMDPYKMTSAQRAAASARLKQLRGK